MQVLLLIGLGVIIFLSVYDGNDNGSTIGIDSGFIPPDDSSPGEITEPDQPDALAESPQRVEPEVLENPVSVSFKNMYNQSNYNNINKLWQRDGSER
jgi:hypothetical protein